MSTGDRSKNIRQNVMTSLKDPSGLGDGQVEIVYDSLNRVQRRIAEEVECLEDTFQIILISGQELYTLPSDFLRERLVVPVGSSVPIVQIGKEDLGRLRLVASQSGSSSPDLAYYYKWNGEIGFMDANGNAPSTSSTITLYYWRYPNIVSEVMSDRIDPVLDQRWDTALFYGALADINGEDRWEAKFNREMDRVKGVERTNQSEPGYIPVNRSYD
jgi:hypothetical protein